LPGIHEVQAHRLAGCAVQAKVEPLGKFAGVVGADVELDVLRVSQAEHLNGTGIELAGNVECGHGVFFDEWR